MVEHKKVCGDFSIFEVDNMEFIVIGDDRDALRVGDSGASIVLDDMDIDTDDVAGDLGFCFGLY